MKNAAFRISRTTKRSLRFPFRRSDIACSDAQQSFENESIDKSGRAQHRLEQCRIAPAEQDRCLPLTGLVEVTQHAIDGAGERIERSAVHRVRRIVGEETEMAVVEFQ